MKTEIELKFYPVNKEDIRIKLSDAGFSLVHPEFLQTRSTFDLKTDADSWGRVRRERDRTTMTIKKHSKEMRFGKESEVTINDYDAGVDFMESAGFVKKSQQENLREVWQKDNIEACIDTWPGMEPYMEIESDMEDAVSNAATSLGLNPSDGFAGGVFDLMESVMGIPMNDLLHIPEITFKNPLVKTC
jgi:adenylate cyclase class 2